MVHRLLIKCHICHGLREAVEFYSNEKYQGISYKIFKRACNYCSNAISGKGMHFLIDSMRPDSPQEKLSITSQSIESQSDKE